MVSQIVLSRPFRCRSLGRRLFSNGVDVLETAKEPPVTVNSIPTGSASVGDANVVIRNIGCTRRVFLLDPHMTTDEIEGLAYRMKMMTKNGALNCILIATSDDDDRENGALPSSLVETDYTVDNVDKHTHPADSLFHVAGGYDPIEIFRSGKYLDTAALQRILDGISDLALTTRGDAETTKIPVITLPHGLVNDGGYALCMGGFVLATPETSFRIMNPSRGLALDPIGLSFMLPRLGWEHQLLSAEYVGCGLLLALTGMQADASDMMETGLATHFIESASVVGSLERSISDIPPWDQQKLYRKPPRLYGQPAISYDVNAKFRNVALASLVHSFASYNVTGKDIISMRTAFSGIRDDPSVDLDYTPPFEHRVSALVNYAATFDGIFKEENSVAGIAERFREIAARDSLDEEEREGIAVAKELAERMRKQSPLALNVVYSLMERGAKKGQTLESCMKREKQAQLKMFQFSDFEKWAKHSSSGGDHFQKWQHDTLADVSQDQVDEIIGSY